MDEMIKKSYDEETKNAIIQWGSFIIHVNLETGRAKYYRGNDEHLDLPDFRLIWDQDRIYQAMCAVKGEKFKSSSPTNIKPIKKESSTTDDYKYYFFRDDMREDFLKTKSNPNRDYVEGILIRNYLVDMSTNDSHSFPVYICKIRDIRNDWESTTKGAFEVALNIALEKIGLSRDDLPEPRDIVRGQYQEWKKQKYKPSQSKSALPF